MKEGLNKSISGGLGLVSAMRLGRQWWCRIGERTAARTLVVAKCLGSTMLVMAKCNVLLGWHNVVIAKCWSGTMF